MNLKLDKEELEFINSHQEEINRILVKITDSAMIPNEFMRAVILGEEVAKLGVFYWALARTYYTH